MTEKASYVSDYTKSETEYTALIENPETVVDDKFTYPGNRRHIPFVSGPPTDHVLIRTGGNALQAIPRSVYEQNVGKQNVLAVAVPESTVPGDPVLVRNQNNNKVVQTTVPPQAVPGQTIFVQFPVEEAPTAAVMGVEPLHDLELTSADLAAADPTSTRSSDFVLIKVPEGYAPGSKLLVQQEGGNTVEVVVPSDPSIREFYMHVKELPRNITKEIV